MKSHIEKYIFPVDKVSVLIDENISIIGKLPTSFSKHLYDKVSHIMTDDHYNQFLYDCPQCNLEIGLSSNATKEVASNQNSVEIWNKYRVNFGRPQWNNEFQGNESVLEVGLIHSIHFTKGCYTGQESVVNSYANIRRRLYSVDVTIASSETLIDLTNKEIVQMNEEGIQIVVGRITSFDLSKVKSGVINAIALLKTSAVLSAHLSLYVRVNDSRLSISKLNNESFVFPHYNVSDASSPPIISKQLNTLKQQKLIDEERKEKKQKEILAKLELLKSKKI